MKRLRVRAEEVSIEPDDGEGMRLFFARWGKKGAYLDLSQEIGSSDVYVELNDQSNGRTVQRLMSRMVGDLLCITLPRGYLQRDGDAGIEVEIDLSGVAYDRQMLAALMAEMSG